jgi:hypothetical protein
MGLFDNLIPQQTQQDTPPTSGGSSAGGLFSHLIPQNQAPVSPGTPAPDYDMAGYTAKYGQPNQSNGQHLTDEFKLPNHMTFSSESKYSTPDAAGGQWKQENGKWNFYASPFNLQQHSAEEMQNYFKQVEPNSILHLPASSFSSSSNDVGINNPGKAKASVVPQTYIGAYGEESMEPTEAPNKYARYVAASPFMAAVRYGNEIGKASGEIPDDMYQSTSQTIAKFNQEKAAEGDKIAPGQRFVKDIAYNPLTYVAGAAGAPASTLGRLALGAGWGTIFAGAEPNATPGSVATGAATGLGFAGLGELGIAGYNAFNRVGQGTDNGAVISDYVGKRVADATKKPISSVQYETPTEVLAAAKADPRITLPAYNYDTINQASQTDGVAGQAAKEYAKRLLVSTSTEASENGTPLLIHTGNLDAGASKIGESLAAEPLSGVNKANVRQGEQLKTILNKEYTDATIQANNIPYDFAGPGKPLGNRFSPQLQDAMNKPGADNLDMIKTSFMGKLAENKAVSNANYAKIESNINGALKNDTSLPIDFPTDDEGLPGRMSYHDAKLQVSKWESDIDRMVKSGNRIDAYNLMQRKNALDDAADFYAEQVIPGDPAPAKASDFYRQNVAPYQNKNGGIIQTIRAVDADQAVNRLFNPTAEDRFARNFDMLGSKGQAAARAEILRRGIQEGNNGREIDLGKVTDYFHSRRDQIGHAFGGVDDGGNGTNNILNLTNFMRNAPQAGVRSGGLSLLDQGLRAATTLGAGGLGSVIGGPEVGGVAAILKAGYQYGRPAYSGYRYLHPDISPFLKEAPEIRGISFSPRDISPITPGQPSLGFSSETPALNSSTPSGGGLNTPKYGPVPTTNQGSLPAQPIQPQTPRLTGSMNPAQGGKITGPITPSDDSYSLLNKGFTYEDEMRFHSANRNRVSTKAEYDAVHSGEAYTAADGTQGIKPKEDGYIGKPDKGGKGWVK